MCDVSLRVCVFEMRSRAFEEHITMLVLFWICGVRECTSSRSSFAIVKPHIITLQPFSFLDIFVDYITVSVAGVICVGIIHI